MKACFGLQTINQVILPHCRVQYEHITTAVELTQLCDDLASAGIVAFDTEFVSEDSYRPHLCLLQIAAAGRLAIVDTLTIEDLTPFWNLLLRPDVSAVVHAGRQELCFCLQATGRRPNRLLDIQLAAGMVGLEYPAAYSTLVSKLLGETLRKGETRTDWRRRPLSASQLDYAVCDVVHLEELFKRLVERMQKMDRLSWFDSEMDRWQTEIETSELRERWRRVSGISGLSRQSLAIVRELWRWREAEAERQNRPARRVLRDDLIVELAKRGTADVRKITAVRGLNHRDKQRYLPTISACVQKARELPESEWPRYPRRSSRRPQYNLLGQFLASTLQCICREQEIATSLVGTVQDVRDLIAYHLDSSSFTAEDVPALARGWRADIVGTAIEEVLEGKRSIAVVDPHADQPLAIEPRQK